MTGAGPQHSSGEQGQMGPLGVVDPRGEEVGEEEGGGEGRREEGRGGRDEGEGR